MKNKKLSNLLILAVIASCTLAPNYKRPKVELPLEQPASAAKKKIAIISWQEYFVSPDLQRVIQTALFNNRDITRFIAELFETKFNPEIEVSLEERKKMVQKVENKIIDFYGLIKKNERVYLFF